MTNLVTLEEYKEAKGITSVKEDLRINALVESVSQLVKTYCGNSFIDYTSQVKAETFNIEWNDNMIQVTESPLRSVEELTERTSLSAARTLLVENVDYVVDKATDSIFRVNSSGSYKSWPKGPASVRIEYLAGYTETPADLKLAIFDLITYYLKEEHKERKTLAGATVQNQGSSTQANNVAFPDHIKRVLDLYKNF